MGPKLLSVAVDVLVRGWARADVPVWDGHSCPSPLILLVRGRARADVPLWDGHSCPSPLILLS
jgi:hypothetical protein